MKNGLPMKKTLAIMSKWTPITPNLLCSFYLSLSFLIFLQYHSLDVYKEFLFDDIKSVLGVSVFSRGQYAGTSSPSLASGPRSRPKEWSTFWHPIFGTCFTFKPSKSLVSYVGLAGLDFVKIDIDFAAAFPPSTSNYDFSIVQVSSSSTFYEHLFCRKCFPQLLSSYSQRVLYNKTRESVDAYADMLFDLK